MKSKIKLVLIGTIGIVSSIVVFHYFVRNYQERLFTQWVMAYEDGDDISARKIANKMDLFDKKQSVFYLAHMAVSDSIKSSSNRKISLLTNALETMNASDFSRWPNQRPVFALKASISALLGDDKNAIFYANLACRMYVSMNIERCFEGPLAFGDPDGSRWIALEYYEQSSLYNVIGSGDKTKSRFYEAIALKYFDIGQARLIYDELAHYGLFTVEMKKTYCNMSSPIDVTSCKKE